MFLHKQNNNIVLISGCNKQAFNVIRFTALARTVCIKSTECVIKMPASQKIFSHFGEHYI